MWLLLARADKSLSYPYGFNNTATSLQNKIDSVSSVFENGAKVFSEIFEDTKTTIDYLSGVAMKLDEIFTGLINKLAGWKSAAGPYVGKKDAELEARLTKLDKEIQDDIQEIKKKRAESEVTLFLSGVREKIMEASRGKQFIGEKVGDINKAANEVLVVLADETKNIQAKAKPVVDVIGKVEELIHTPEVQAIGKGFNLIVNTVSNLFQPTCQWDYGTEKYVQLVSYSRSKYWVDEEWITCLLNEGHSIWSITHKLSSRTGAPFDYVEEYIYNNKF